MSVILGPVLKGQAAPSVLIVVRHPFIRGTKDVAESLEVIALLVPAPGLAIQPELRALPVAIFDAGALCSPYLAHRGR